MKSNQSMLLTLAAATAFIASTAIAEDIVHDAEYYILKAQNGERWATEDKALVSFNAFGDFAMNILFIYYIKSGADILEAQTDINMEVLNRFNKEGLEFAFPTQTLYTKQA